IQRKRERGKVRVQNGRGVQVQHRNSINWNDDQVGIVRGSDVVHLLRIAERSIDGRVRSLPIDKRRRTALQRHAYNERRSRQRPASSSDVDMNTAFNTEEEEIHFAASFAADERGIRRVDFERGVSGYRNDE